MMACKKMVVASQSHATGEDDACRAQKMLSHSPRQVDFPSGQVTFHSHLPDGQEI